MGCLIYLGKGVEFFKNGISQGMSPSELLDLSDNGSPLSTGIVCKGLTGKVFPVLGIRSRGAHVQTNFGQEPYKYDVGGFLLS